MIIRYTSDARNDLEEITQHIRAASPSGARKVARRIRSIIELLKSHPRAGRATEVAGIRRLVASPYPYLIFYEVAENAVVIHAIRHGARNPNEMPGASGNA